MPTVSWKLPPQIHGDNSTANNRTRGGSSLEETPIDGSEFNYDNPFGDDNSFDDDNSLIYGGVLSASANNWKIPPSNFNDSSTKKTPTDWKVRSSFNDDDDNSTVQANNWEVPPSTLGDSSTKKIPTDWKDRSSLDNDDDSVTPASKWKVPPSTLGDTKKTPTDWKVRSSFDNDDDNLTAPVNHWKLPPSTLGYSSTKKTPTDWKDRSSFDDDDDSITPAATSKWNLPPSTLGDTKKTPTDWKVRSSFDDDDDNSTAPVNHWKLPPSTLGDSSTKKTPTDWKVRSSFDDDDDDDDSNSPVNKWKVSSSTLGDTKKSPTGWKVRPSFGGYSEKATPADNWKLPPIIEDDGSSRTTSDDNPEVPPPPPPIHDNNSMNTIPTYTPYLQLPHLLSLAWVTYPVISLIFVAFRLQLSLASAENGLDNLKNDLLASCTAAEKAATAAASLPRYMAETSNQQLADSANRVISAAQSALILSLTILENTLNFVIDMYRSTFLCLLELAIGTGFSLVSGAVQALSTSVASIGKDLASQIASANNALTSSIDQINKADPFHKISAPPTISASDLNSLQNLTLPSSFQSTLTSLNSSMPTASQLKGAIEDLIDTPFVLLKRAVNNTFNNLSFDATLFPVPAENQLLFCHHLDVSSIDSFKADLIKVARYGTIVIIGLALVLIGLNCLLIWYQWRSKKRHLERTRQAWVSDPVLNPNAFSEFSPSAPQGNPSDHNLMMSKAPAPEATLDDHNSMMSEAASPSAPQETLSNRNSIMSQATFPSVSQKTLNNRDSIMSQASAARGNLGDHNLMMSQTSAPQGNLGDHNLMMSQVAPPAAPQFTLSNHNMMMLEADSVNPFITRIMYVLAARTGMTPSQNIDMRWFFHYVFHPPALACFLIGFFGLMSVMTQLFLLGPLLAAARAGVNVAIADLTKTITNAINATMYNQSATYANDINSKVDVIQNTINNGVFNWVNGTTTLLNNTINTFYTDIQNFVSHLFNGTVLENPALGFLQCIVGSKVDDVEKALAFMRDNLFINIPRVSEDILVLSAATVNEATAPIASGAAGSGSNGNQGILGEVVALYEASLKAEAVIFGIFMGLWGVVLATAICILLWRVHKRKRAAAAAKRQRVNSEVPVELKNMELKNMELKNVELTNVELKNMEGSSNSSESFPNDEKKDPFVD